MTDLRKKFKRKTWFAEGEELRAACLALAQGSAWTQSLLGPLGGKPHRIIGEGGAAARMPDGQLILALTDRRLVAFRSKNQAPKTELTSWGIGELASIGLEQRRVIHRLRLTFSDGSAIELDAGRAGEPERLVEAFSQR